MEDGGVFVCPYGVRGDQRGERERDFFLSLLLNLFASPLSLRCGSGAQRLCDARSAATSSSSSSSVRSVEPREGVGAGVVAGVGAGVGAGQELQAPIGMRSSSSGGVPSSTCTLSSLLRSESERLLWTELLLLLLLLLPGIS